jgi:hypothetical protein
MLMPLLDKNTERLRHQSEVLQYETLQKAIDPWFASQHVGLLEIAIAETGRLLEKNRQDLIQIEDELTTLRDQEKEISFNIRNDQAGQRLHQLQEEKKRSEAELAKRRIAARNYATIARSLDLREEPDYTAFFTSSKVSETLQMLYTTKLRKKPNSATT